MKFAIELQHCKYHAKNRNMYLIECSLYQVNLVNFGTGFAMTTCHLLLTKCHSKYHAKNRNMYLIEWTLYFWK